MPVANQSSEPAAANRRSFHSGHGEIALSATAIALLTGRGRFSFIRSANAETVNKDVAVLNAALGAEQEAVVASLLGVNWGLLQRSVIDLAVSSRITTRSMPQRWKRQRGNSAERRSTLQSQSPVPTVLLS
jgi:hypothetical protein